MAFFSPIPLIRKNMIVRKRQKSGAISEDTAKTLEEVGVINPRGFSRITDMVVKKRYY